MVYEQQSNIVLYIVVIILCIVIAVIVSDEKRRASFCKDYGITKRDIKGFKIKKTGNEIRGTFILQFPVWLFSKRDGTRDLRHRGNNKIVWKKNELYLGKYAVFTKYPFAMYILVNKIRDANDISVIGRCSQEELKYRAVKQMMEDMILF